MRLPFSLTFDFFVRATTAAQATCNAITQLARTRGNVNAA